jgi:hypothetical protein
MQIIIIISTLVMIINVHMPVNQIVSHISEPYWYSMTAAILIIMIINHAYTGPQDSFRPLRALLVLHDRGIFWPSQLASLDKRGGPRLVCGERCVQGDKYPTNRWLYLVCLCLSSEGFRVLGFNGFPQRPAQ